MLKFTERPKALRMSSKKNISFHEGNKLYAFLANLDEMNADLAQFTKRWN